MFGVVIAEKGDAWQTYEALGLALDFVAVAVDPVASGADREEGQQRLGLEFPLPATRLEDLAHRLGRSTGVAVGRQLQADAPGAGFLQAQVEVLSHHNLSWVLVDLHRRLFDAALRVIVLVQFGPPDVDTTAHQGLAQRVRDLEPQVDLGAIPHDDGRVVPRYAQRLRVVPA